MIKSFKFRIYPNKEQEQLIQKTFGCVRFVYNYFLCRRTDFYNKTGKDMEINDCFRELTQLKTQYEWLKEPDKWALQNTLRDLEQAYRKFYRIQKKGPKFTQNKLKRLDRLGKTPTLYDMNGHPKFKSKKNDKYMSYRTTFNNNNIRFGDKIRLPKLGWVKYSDNRESIQGRILNATVVQEPSGKYYCSICCTDVDKPEFIRTDRYVGIDLGIHYFAATSDGVKYENPRYLTKILPKLARLNRSLSRKPAHGSNHEKARIRVAKLWEHVRNQRNDFIKKLVCELVNEYDVICIENLPIAKMLGSSKQLRKNYDVPWYGFREILHLVADEHGKEVVVVDTLYPSSQLCSNCGYKNEKVKDLSIREWTCPNCGSHHDRDINAAINILNEGKRILGIE